MKILILGIDGYIGFPLSLHLKRLGHEVWGLDNFSRRTRAAYSLTPYHNTKIDYQIDLDRVCPSCLPEIDTIVHLAEQPSAPWSMVNFDQANKTQMENVSGTLRVLWMMKEYFPDAHLLKLGTMGEYGTPEIPIPEGFIDLRPCEMAYPDNCPMEGMMFPRQPGSFYHLSKVFDSMNIDFACRMWGLRSTDIMQGVVFGLNDWDNDLTRFDYDQYFGTVINRFCAQAISGHPLTVYGGGGQTRGYLPLSDSIECLTRSIVNPPVKGEYRVFNQYAEILSVNEIAEAVQSVCDLPVQIEHIKNPRKEKENHTYETSNANLSALGYEKKWLFKEEIHKLIASIMPFRRDVKQSVIIPTHSWT